MLRDVHVGLKELQSPEKLGNVLAGSSSPPLLPPAHVSSVTVAGRLQCEGQIPAAFPSWKVGPSDLWDGRTGVYWQGSHAWNTCPGQGNSLEEQECDVFGSLFLALCSCTWKC